MKAEKAANFVTEFKKFIMRGNVVDMAVGVVVGGAFSKIVSSLVADIITPLIGMATSGADLSSMAVTLKEAAGETEAVLLKYGVFLQNIIDFLIIAFCIFCVVRLMQSLRRKEEAPPAPPAPPEPSAEEKLLTEIRDLLKDGKR